MTNNTFSYTKRDYEGSRKEGIANIPITSDGKWTDLNATDPGIIILDYVHALVDMVQYYQDHQALESFIVTAKERENIFRLAKQLSYKIRSAKGARCVVTFSSGLLYDYTIRIPKGTILGTSSGIKYLTAEDGYLLPNTSQINISCTQGTRISREYKGTGISRYSQIVAAANQYVILPESNIDTASIQIIDSANRVWDPTDYLIFSNELDRVYQIDLNSDDTITIRFGDGMRGVVPKTADTLTISYIVTDATEGKVGAHMINKLEQKVYNDSEQYIELDVDNALPSIGGSNIPTSEEIKELAPGMIKAQGRAVTLADFEILARQVDGVADAKAYDINTRPDQCLYHEVKVMIVPKDIFTDVKLLEAEVTKYLRERMVPPTNLQVLLPTAITVDISVTVKRVEYSVEGGLAYTIERAIIKYFTDRMGAIGESFYPTDLAVLIGNIPDVRSVVSLTPTKPVVVNDLSTVILGKLNVTVI